MTNKSLKNYFPIAEAISLLLYPHAEVVIHDLSTKCIAVIHNNFSKRKAGDESLLDGMHELTVLPDVFPLYIQTNWDGRNMRSATAALRDQKGNVIGLLCINLDLSKWEAMRDLLEQWLQSTKMEEKPEALFKDDWREKINSYVSDYLKQKGVSLKALAKKEKQGLVRALHREGAFSAKNAASYAADVLEISRATIYNYLKKS
jgi:D-arginine utilization repressor